jgi:hypothetical protein
MRGCLKIVTGSAWLFSAVLLLAALMPATSYGQAAIAGTVRDSSGAVLPGATVEASSPALIEKVRSAATDGSGQYRIEDLRPGTYTVTFTLSGFTTVRREGIELTGSFTATVNAEMRVGAVAETITVTGETPVVDVQSAQRQTVLTKDIIGAIPTAGTYNSLLVLVPGVFGGQQDVDRGPCISCTFSTRGSLLTGRANSEGRLQLDGLSFAVPQAGGTNYLVDTRNAQEVNFTTSGSLGEIESGGPVLNVIPRTGGNMFSGTAFGNVADSSMQGSNFTQELKDAGLASPNPLIKLYDVSGAFGGPLKKDRLWFFATERLQGSSSYISGLYYNKNAGDPNAWTYVPDFSRQAYEDHTWENTTLRLTWQATPRHKFNVFWDEQIICPNCENGGLNANPLFSPEANGKGDFYPQRLPQATWSSTLTNRILLEAGVGGYIGAWGGRPKDDPNTQSLARIVEQCTAGCPVNGNIPNLNYRSQTTIGTSDAQNLNETYTWRAAASLVTGTHSVKIGYIGTHLIAGTNSFRGPADLSYRVNNGVPNQLTEYITNFVTEPHTRDDGFFAQEQWTRKRLTLQGALRFDHSWSYSAPVQEGPTRFLPTPLIFPRTPGVDSFWDVTPRMSAIFDVRGDGRTAVKVNAGRYLESTITGSNFGLQIPTSRIAGSSVTRTWTDANGNFVPDCNLSIPDAQDLRASGGDFCAAISNANFGKAVFNNTIDPALLSGWGVRPSDWSIGASIQHEVLPRVSVEAGYTRRWYEGFIVTDNLAVTPSDFGSFSVTAPLDSRLPGGGGQVISGLYDVNPALFGVTNNYVTKASAYGNEYNNSNSLDVSVTARPRNGLSLQAGFSGGKTVLDTCDIRAKLPETAPLNPYCHVESGFLPQFKAISSYTIPKIDVQVSGTVTSKPGIQVNINGTPTGVVGGAIGANYTVSNAVVAQSLGRSLSGNAPNVTVNLITPGELYGDRVNEIDVRFAKVLRFGSTKTLIGVDIYNLANSSAVLSYNQAFIPNGSWLTPTSIMSARFAKISAQFDF